MNLTQRQTDIIRLLQTNRVLSNKKLVDLMGNVSRITIARELKILLERGNIQKSGQGRGVSYALPADFVPPVVAQVQTLTHEDLFDNTVDIGGRDLIIGFNECAFKKSSDEISVADLDSKLNARLPSYFLPAVQIARMQSVRPRLIVVSGIFAALKWNATSDRERRIMLINNALKVDFLRSFFERFFPDAFSLVEFRNAVDFLKISDRKLELLWRVFERKYPKESAQVKHKLLQYQEPKAFAQGIPEEKILDELLRVHERSLQDAFKYALAHLFVLADINLSWDFSHNPKGYCSIGEHHEAIFNIVRSVGFEVLKEVGEIVFDQEVFVFENQKIVIDSPYRTPPAYNGAFRKSGSGPRILDEVTYENNYDLAYYEDRPRLKPAMDYLYRLVPRNEYEAFWSSYRERYSALKKRYQEAYGVEGF